MNSVCSGVTLTSQRNSVIFFTLDETIKSINDGEEGSATHNISYLPTVPIVEGQSHELDRKRGEVYAYLAK